ncbi:DEAD/DEAH box helicase [Pseudomonas fluorescens group sp.]|uniref:ATP-dependent helicase n=2 Tax=Pseudomonas fluorescens TaxID=294 RepID=C3K2T4_PSEFS|nr:MULTISPECIES: DEAD/DEAH box helicase [Pseudomonas fluorescens group]MBZ6458376.1 DEAD/DEAH box helicase [Pseudomonas fluorescens group sp.]MBZ6461828.1 DEAD/DEAH box helicase [Pseudomonas fluorescens group sp.]MBZ6467542.1 DEAD/DEAH box helicase [Pseudomonas fluorescens group sp.]WQD71751.1 DEAD/DEAH box helicase [Pseudomonas marginalis]CAI2799624.1 Putative ATP-dependent helicase [Pseudomonas fluorescens SBW25]
MNLPESTDTALTGFHPAVSTWFRSTFPSVTGAQAQAWPLIRQRQSTLIAAPTGSGKTLTAFLAVLDDLVHQGLANGGELPDETLVVYVSPLKALSNDIQINLQNPLAGITEHLRNLGLPPLAIRTAVRTGDTPQKDRALMRKRPPHILVTTPESLYVLLGSDSGRQMLASTRTVIIDEIHAIAAGKRGSHLALSLERLQGLCAEPLMRIGLSATQKPIDAVSRFLVGSGRACAIVDIGHARPRDLDIEVPPVPLSAVMANDVWERVYDRLAELAREHRTTLIFVNTRRLAERLARHLSERLGKTAVAAHHGSLAKEMRLDAEQRLKGGELQVLIATASLELGIDIGDVDLVCQIGSPGSINGFLQRVGRSRHQVGGTPKGRLFATTRDDLIECAALLDCVRRGELDTLQIPVAPLDVLAQQIIAEVSAQEWSEQALLALIHRAAPYATLDERHYQALLQMLSDGYNGRQGIRSAYLHRDALTRTLRGRRGAKLTAVTSGGTIPDNADYSVLLEPQSLNIGSVNEDFAVESIAGDIFQLGNTSYRILRVEAGKVRVEDAHGQPPTIPFWLGEAPGRSHELSAAVARLQGQMDALLSATPGDLHAAQDWLTDTLGLNRASAEQILDYLARARLALSALPSQDTLIMERFFDASGGTQLIIHTPFGSRVNRAWGLALRKRFCRTFNVELQAAASENAIVLSLSTSHSFELDEVWRYLNSQSAEHILIQAVLDAPLFGVRWRWNAGVALALPRYTGGRKVAPQIQRMKSEDLIASVFPDQIACLENLAGEREVPEHPLVEQTLDDCLHEAMDSEGWLALLRRMEHGEVRLISRDLPAPSPMAAEILSARPYTFLDDAPLEERRTQAVLNRRWSDPQSTDDLGALDADAIAGVREEAWPAPNGPDEMHEALMSLACIADNEVTPQWATWLHALAQSGRAYQLHTHLHTRLWVAVERLSCVQTIYPGNVPLLPGFDEPWTVEEAVTEVLRARLGGFGPLSLIEIAAPLALPVADVTQALARLEHEGYVLRGHFSPGATQEQWCERHLLARIHRYTVKRLRREIEPVALQDFMRFLFDWQHLSDGTRGQGSAMLPQIVGQFEGYAAATSAWDSDLLSARLKDYSSTWLDELCRSGKLVWTRLSNKTSAMALRSTPVVLLPRNQVGLWSGLTEPTDATTLSPKAQKVHQALRDHGALFFDELVHEAHLLRSELETALQELVGAGVVNADSFAGLRALTTPASKRQARSSRRGRGAFIGGMDDAGRWALIRRPSTAAGPPSAETLEHVAMTLLRRYGVVFWRLLEREAEWLPSWRELLRTFHRLEARGEIRGGRFVSGLAGEQFALPEAIPLLREVRRRPHDGSLIAVCGADPLNLVGTLLPGTKVPAVSGNRIVYRDGLPAAVMVAGKQQVLVEVDRQAVQERLIRH